MFLIHFQFYQVLSSNQIHDTNKFQLDVFKAMNHNGYVIKDSFWILWGYVYLNKYHSHLLSWHQSNTRTKSIYLYFNGNLKVAIFSGKNLLSLVQFTKKLQISWVFYFFWGNTEKRKKSWKRRKCLNYVVP